jgi:hypothetical protein
MSLLRFAAVAALAVWVGGLVALGAVGAPQIFATLQQHDPVAGRELAGEVFGAIFTRFQYVAWSLAVVVLGSLGARAALGPRPRRMAVRMWMVTAMLAASLTTAFYITPEIEHIRETTSGPIANVSVDNPQRQKFGRLHGLSNGLALATVLLGVVLIWIELRDQH